MELNYELKKIITRANKDIVIRIKLYKILIKP